LRNSASRWLLLQELYLSFVPFLAGLSQLRYSTESSFSGYCEWNNFPEQGIGLRETVNVHSDSIRCGKCT